MTNAKRYDARVAANENDEFRFYIYCWQYPDGRTFYVGKGCGRRDKRPKHQNNKIFERIVAKIRSEGGEPIIVRWHDGLRENDAFQLEMAYIKLFGRRDNGTGVLANLTDGGEGASGWVPSDEARSKMSVAHRGNQHALGYKHTEETLAKLSSSHVGKRHSAETLAKMGAAQRGRVISAEHRAKIAETTRLKPPVSGFKGVHREPRGWRAQIRLDGVCRNLGTFSTAELAAATYDAAAYAAYGNRCYLNFGLPEAVAA